MKDEDDDDADTRQEWDRGSKTKATTLPAITGSRLEIVVVRTTLYDDDSQVPTLINGKQQRINQKYHSQAHAKDASRVRDDIAGSIDLQRRLCSALCRFQSTRMEEPTSKQQ
jgi:hypothetical protein